MKSFFTFRTLRVTTATLTLCLLSGSRLLAHPGHQHTRTSQPAQAGQKAATGKMLTLRLSGLHCEGCAGSVQAQLLKVPGVQATVVSQKTQTALVTCGKQTPTDATLKAAVKSAGYQVVKIEAGKPAVPVQKNQNTAVKKTVIKG